MNRNLAAHPARPLVLTVLLAIVLLLGAGTSAWATPAQRPLGQTVPTITPGVPPTPAVTPPPSRGSGAIQQLIGPGIKMEITAGAGSVVIPANALSVPGTLEVAPLAADQLPAASAGYALLGEAVDTTLFDANGRPIGQPSFANPFQVCLNYTAGDLAKAGGDAANLVVMHYDKGTDTWVALPATPDTTGGQICGSTSQIGTFALAGRSSGPDVLPRTGVVTPEQQQLADRARLVWGIMLLTAAVVVVFVLVRRRRRKRQG